MLNITTIIGTRPELIRLSRIIPKLDKLCNHTLIHTGQNYDYNLKDVFFIELGVRHPDIFLGLQTSNFGEQIGGMFQKIEKLFKNKKPDKVLVLGDTNSGLCAIVCERMGIPVYHMEAGNRCFDKRVPEEINRKIIDSISSFNLPYTNLSKENLINDGCHKSQIFVTGNPIYEVIKYYEKEINGSKILDKLSLKPKKFFLATFHRAENVDNQHTLYEILKGLSIINKKYDYPVICSIHPRTKSKFDKDLFPNLQFHEPFGFFDFVRLEDSASCVISDSGTVAEETTILQTPNVIIRRSTERPEVIECGANILSGTCSSDIERCVDVVLNSKTIWDIPTEYLVEDVSDRIVKILLGEHKCLIKES